MIFSENRCPLFGIMLLPPFPSLPCNSEKWNRTNTSRGRFQCRVANRQIFVNFYVTLGKGTAG